MASFDVKAFWKEQGVLGMAIPQKQTQPQPAPATLHNPYEGWPDAVCNLETLQITTAPVHPSLETMADLDHNSGNSPSLSSSSLLGFLPRPRTSARTSTGSGSATLSFVAAAKLMMTTRKPAEARMRPQRRWALN